MNRIAGLETEYGCLAREPETAALAVQQARDWVFHQARLGLVDLHQRDWDEPPGNGGFLFNGGRVYVDMGHLEYCTPECRSLLDVLRYDRAGDRILNSALTALRLEASAGFIRNNVDHYSGATFGCHENYLVRRSAPLTESGVQSLLAYLTLRLLYTGAGRVGTTKAADGRTPVSRPGAADVFQLSQRADYINNDLFEWVQFNRAIINTRDEPLADGRLYRRLHLLHGDTNVLPSALLLKVGATALILDLLEAGSLPEVALADPVATFHALSREPSGPWLVRLQNGRTAEAVEMLRAYSDAARGELFGRDAETDFLIRFWEETSSLLSSAPDELVGRVDWITKKWLFERFMQDEGLGWGDPWLKSQDLEYHHIDQARSLAAPLERTPEGWRVSEEEISRAMRNPPGDTRAGPRSRAMRSLGDRSLPYYLDWEVVGLGGGPSLPLDNPLSADLGPVEAWVNGLEDHLSAEDAAKAPSHE